MNKKDILIEHPYKPIAKLSAERFNKIKPDYPIIILFARDWNLFKEQTDIDVDFYCAEMFVVGFLLKEKKDSYVVAAELNLKEQQVRYAQVIPKENVIWKHIFKEY